MSNKWLKDEAFLRWRFFRTEKDQLFWECFIKENPEAKGEIDEAIQLLKSVKLNDFILSTEEKLEMYDRIRKHIETHQRNKRIRHYLTLSAAAAGIALFLFLSDVFVPRTASVPESTLATVAGDTTATGKDIRLLMADNQTLSFDRNTDIQYDTKGCVVVNTEDDRVTKEMEDATVRLNKLIVPFGKRSSLTLEDGTKVWINSGSTLEFPTAFQSDRREIAVEGEVYIEVAKKPEQPFYINTAHLLVKVLGTRINVSAYREDVTHSVVLVEGEVEVDAGKEKIFLLPDQMLSITGNQATKKDVNVYDYISWKDGLLRFSSEPLLQILTRLSRYYDIPVICEEGTGNVCCTGKLVLFDRIEDVLQTIQHTTPFNYVLREDKIYIQK